MSETINNQVGNLSHTKKWVAQMTHFCHLDQPTKLAELF